MASRKPTTIKANKLITVNSKTTRQDHVRALRLKPDDLAPLLGWLATLPLAEVRIEPLGLQVVYDRYHPAESAA